MRTKSEVAQPLQEYLATVRNKAASVLRDHGFESEWEDTPKAWNDILDLHGWGESRTDIPKPVQYAVRVLVQTHRLGISVIYGGPNEIALSAIKLQRLISATDWAIDEPNIDSGKKSRQGGSKGRANRPIKATAEQARKEIDAVFADHPRWGITDIRTEAAIRLGLAPGPAHIGRITKYYNPTK